MLEGDQRALEVALADQYRFVRELGRGGWGTVWLADDLKHHRPVAIKILRLETATAKPRERFLREIDIASHLKHPNIVAVLDAGSHEGALYYVMPFVDGETLQQRLRREAQLPVVEALRIAGEVAAALAEAHAHGVIHRDIKPANILLSGERVLVVDFGIARAYNAAAPPTWESSSRQLIGTPEYMSAEQASGDKELDGRTDIYSLGCVLYEMLAGTPPFTAGTQAAVMARHALDPVPSLRTVRPSASAAVERVVMSALGKSPADRFATADEMKAAIAIAATDADVGGTRAHISRVYRHPHARRVTALAVGALLLGVTVWRRFEPGPVAHAGVRTRVAVGIFENRTGGQQYDRVGVMAADWVTDGLQRTGVLDVVPTATALAAAQYLSSRASVDPVRALAEETGANFVITGSVYMEGDSLVFRAQLNDVAKGRVAAVVEPIRAGQGDPSVGLAQLRGRLMGTLVLSLDERLGPATSQSAAPPTYAAYLAFSDGLDAYVRNAYGPASTAFQLANRLDSTFVLPLLYLAICHTNKGEFSASDSVLHVVEKHRNQLSPLDRSWLDYSQAASAGLDMQALEAIRRAALLAPGSKASYNFAVQAFEARLPFPAESALRQLPPDRGPMRGWLPYWQLLTSALHAQRKHGEELVASRAALRQFPDRIGSYSFQVVALSALRKRGDLEPVLAAAERNAGPTSVEMGELFLVAATEILAHGGSSETSVLLDRAAASFERAAAGDSIGALWGRMQVALLQSRWRDAVGLGERLLQSDRRPRAAPLLNPGVTRYRGALGVAFARQGNRDQARTLENALAGDVHPFTYGAPQYEAARIAAALGETEKAANLIEQAFTKGYPFGLELHRDPAFDGMREHPLLQPLNAARR